jgi:hypothetical protein
MTYPHSHSRWSTHKLSGYIILRDEITIEIKPGFIQHKFSKLDLQVEDTDASELLWNP